MSGRIPSSFIDQLLLQADIISVIGKHVALQQKGREFVACCPFHSEKTPSFKVNPEKQIFYCFGCGEGGNAISFLMKHQRLNFVEAVEVLAQTCGVDVPRESGSTDFVDKGKQKKKLATLARAADYYHQCLKKNDNIKQYLRSRGIEEALADIFQLGFAPRASGHLRPCFDKEYDERHLMDCGLLTRNQQGQTYEWSRNRLVFPIRNRRGQAIAFGGRVLPGDDSPAKYINSPETKLFQKRNELYGVYELREAGRYDRIIVVEGYMDVVSLAQHGVRNVVATLGTASTRTHIQKLLRIVPHIVFCFDADTAGERAAIRAMEHCLSVFVDGYAVDFMFLPQGHDPDSFVREHGKEAFDKAVQGAKPIADFLFEYYAQDKRLDDPAQSAAFAKTLNPLLNQIPAGIFREKMYAKLAAMLGVEVDQLQQDAPARTQAKSAQVATPAGDARHSSKAIRSAIALLLHNPQIAKQLDIDIDAIEQLKNPGGKLMVTIFKMIKERNVTNGASIIERYRDTDYEKPLIALLAAPEGFPQDESIQQAEFCDAIKCLKEHLRDQTIDELETKDKRSEEDNRKLMMLLQQRAETQSA